jgi:uncharacterized SAM-binding protein YcdF (DUF218 family)
VFWLKKAVSFWLMPVPLCLAMLVAGLLLSRRERRARAGRSLLVGGTVLLLLFSNRWASNRLLRPLESQYPPIPEFTTNARVPDALARCRFVVVLGGGHSDLAATPATGKLSSSALARIVEAVRIAGMLPGATLIVSGPAESGHPSHASVLAQAAVSLGIDRARIDLVDTALDTEDEAAAVSLLVGKVPVALVTSAWHMPRAAHLFLKRGVDILPCPTDFNARSGGLTKLSGLGWDSESLERSTLAVHERLGLLWLRIRG